VWFVATTSEGLAGPTPTAVTPSLTRTSLALRGTSLVPLGSVPIAGDAKAVAAVQYSGDVAAVLTAGAVTLIDLRDPARMVTHGAFRVPGFCLYLYRLGPALLLGFGQAVGGPESDPTATAFLLTVPAAAAADGGSPAGPSVVATWTPPPPPARSAAGVGSTWSRSGDYRGLVYLPDRRLVVAPLKAFGVWDGAVDAVALHVDPGGEGLQTVAAVVHRGRARAAERWVGPVSRVVLMSDGRYVWTFAPQSVEVREVDTWNVTCRTALTEGN